MEQGTTPAPIDDRPYSPGLEGVIAGETSIALVDGANGRLIYRGYPIGDLVRHSTYAQVAELLWTGTWPASAHLACAPLSKRVVDSLRNLPASTHPMDALRTALSTWGAEMNPGWPSTVDQARALTATAPTALAAFARLRDGKEPLEPREDLELAAGFLYLLNGTEPDPAAARALDAYFIVGAEHGFNASTFTARVICATRSDIASAIVGAIGALKGPLHGGAPAEVVNQLNEIGTPEAAAAWIDAALARGERLMGFGHRVYRAYDPRAAALREVAEGMGNTAEWLASRGRGGGHRAQEAGREVARSPAPDERRVLHGRRAPGRRAAAGSVPVHVRARPARRLDRACAGAERGQQAHPPGRPLHRPRVASAPRRMTGRPAGRDPRPALEPGCQAAMVPSASHGRPLRP